MPFLMKVIPLCYIFHPHAADNFPRLEFSTLLDFAQQNRKWLFPIDPVISIILSGAHLETLIVSYATALDALARMPSLLQDEALRGKCVKLLTDLDELIVQEANRIKIIARLPEGHIGHAETLVFVPACIFICLNIAELSRAHVLERDGDPSLATLAQHVLDCFDGVEALQEALSWLRDFANPGVSEIADGQARSETEGEKQEELISELAYISEHAEGQGGGTFSKHTPADTPFANSSLPMQSAAIVCVIFVDFQD